MIDHLSLGVRDLAASTRFYDACLAPLGYVRLYASEKGAGYGPPGGEGALDLFAVPGRGAPTPLPGFHVAVTAPTRAAVEAFHAAALAAGGADAGGPGLRPRYGPGYYAAFVVDPDGHKVEAVRHE
jgi:catechol 2,3-dioxygenase-like lactoylglutathione lyase family enzyme